METERNDLYLEFVRLAKYIQPQWIIGENVKGMKEEKRKEICAKFDGIGYEMGYKVLRTQDFGLAQERERVIFVGSSRSFPYVYRWPFPYEYNCPVEPQPLIPLLDKTNGNGGILYYFDATQIPALEVSSISGPVHGCLKHYVEQKPDSFAFDTFRTGKAALILNIHKPCKTIMCSYSWRPKLFVPLRCQCQGKTYLRTLTTDELKRIQGFPASFVIVGKDDASRIRQIGNAIPPPLMTILIQGVFTSIEEQERAWTPLRLYGDIVTEAWQYEVTLERRRHVFSFVDATTANESLKQANECQRHLSCIHPRNNCYLHHKSSGKICLRLKAPNELPNKEWCDTARQLGGGRKRKRVPTTFEKEEDGTERHYIWLTRTDSLLSKLETQVWYWYKGHASARIKTATGADRRVKLLEYIR